MIPVIVDLADTAVILGKFPIQAHRIVKTNTAKLDLQFTQVRAVSIIDEILGLGISYGPLTFYISENWQCFAIVAAVQSFLFISPRVIVVGSDKFEDLVDFYNFTGSLFYTLKGDNLSTHGKVSQIQTSNQTAHGGAS